MIQAYLFVISIFERKSGTTWTGKDLFFLLLLLLSSLLQREIVLFQGQPLLGLSDILSAMTSFPQEGIKPGNQAKQSSLRTGGEKLWSR